MTQQAMCWVSCRNRHGLKFAFVTAGVMEELVAEGAVIVTTSNRPPWELQDHGLHEVRGGTKMAGTNTGTGTKGSGGTTPGSSSHICAIDSS